jgi:hypothetical protein
VLTGSGALAADAAAEVRLDNAREYAPVVLVVSGAFDPTAFKGGLLAPNPAILHVIRRTGGDGSVTIAFEWDGDLPGGHDVYMQFVIKDPEAIGMYALSNVLATTTR